MRLIRKLAALKGSDVALLIPAAVVVVLVRLALWVLPSRVLLRWVGRMVAEAPVSAEPTSIVRRVGWAVRAVSRRVPRASCLTQALATQILLARRGYSSRLRIGVARDHREAFAAHAWVEIDGGVLVGGREARRYRALPDIQPHL